MNIHIFKCSSFFIAIIELFWNIYLSFNLVDLMLTEHWNYARFTPVTLQCYFDILSVLLLKSSQYFWFVNSLLTYETNKSRIILAWLKRTKNVFCNNFFFFFFSCFMQRYYFSTNPVIFLNAFIYFVGIKISTWKDIYRIFQLIC